MGTVLTTLGLTPVLFLYRWLLMTTLLSVRHRRPVVLGATDRGPLALFVTPMSILPLPELLLHRLIQVAVVLRIAIVILIILMVH